MLTLLLSIGMAFLVGILGQLVEAANVMFAWDYPSDQSNVVQFRLYRMDGTCQSLAVKGISADSQELVGENGAATNAIDGTPATFWHTEWYQRTAPLPHTIVLDLGAGYCNFINSVVARRRIAVDSWAGFAAHLAPGIEHKIGSVTHLDFIEDGAVDFAFASNLFEHLTKDDFATALEALRPKLSERGTLTILQPNYRYAFREYDGPPLEPLELYTRKSGDEIV